MENRGGVNMNALLYLAGQIIITLGQPKGARKKKLSQRDGPAQALTPRTPKWKMAFFFKSKMSPEKIDIQRKLKTVKDTF